VRVWPYPVARGENALGIGYTGAVSRWDDDDWTGEPPEGRHSADRADPDFWRRTRPPVSITAAGIGITLIVLLVVWLL
jgi:hypothetical protein